MALAVALLTVPNFRILGATEGHWSSLRGLVTELGEPSGNFFFDVHTAALMREMEFGGLLPQTMTLPSSPGSKSSIQVAR
jgi:hypothetical protein